MARRRAETAPTPPPPPQDEPPRRPTLAERIAAIRAEEERLIQTVPEADRPIIRRYIEENGLPFGEAVLRLAIERGESTGDVIGADE